MSRVHGAVPGDFEDEPPAREEPGDVERQLAQYAFMREEREREVRLLFRDVPADELARTFRQAGASLITLTGERAATFSQPPSETVPQASLPDEAEATETAPSRTHKRRKSATQSTPTGEVLLRYFYSLGGLVYTVGIATSSGVVQSIAGIYPAAALSERELQDRLALAFRNT